MQLYPCGEQYRQERETSAVFRILFRGMLVCGELLLLPRHRYAKTVLYGDSYGVALRRSFDAEDQLLPMLLFFQVDNGGSNNAAHERFLDVAHSGVQFELFAIQSSLSSTVRSCTCSSHFSRR